MNAGPGGFRGAPVTKGLLLGTLSTSIIIQASKAVRRRPPLLVSLFTHAFAFRNPGELLFGASLLYFYRIFERQWGSAKYGSFVATTCCVAYALEAAASSGLGWRSASGPFPLVFANLLSNFVLLVPPMHQFTVFGIKMTDKSFIYLASIQLLLSAAPGSLVAGGAGLLAGLLYRLNFLGLQRLRLPTAVVDFVTNTVGRLLTGPAPAQQVFVTPTAAQLQQQQQALHQQQMQAAGGMGGEFQQLGGRQQGAASRGGGGGGAAAARVVEPSPEAVQQLVAMGFDEAAAMQALRQANNNVEAALQYLL
ncbi:hypothetical protein D9Q98_008043 [Chlorella vulgaris]|uniref:UBA domain-containing protein n=1 Tax=Chlorella vulgaris TaxID=3077 RepID=A0A9D4YTW8_CHLVU|nr:hypothetical protein D9Q98_008043 [Chlorella vulgaris]